MEAGSGLERAPQDGESAADQRDDVMKRDDHVGHNPEEPVSNKPEPPWPLEVCPEACDGGSDMTDLHGYLASLPPAAAIDYAIELLDSSYTGLDASLADTVDLPDDSFGS